MSKASNHELADLCGARKVAAFLHGFERAQAESLLGKLDPALAAAVALAMDGLDPTSLARERQDELVREFTRELNAAPTAPLPRASEAPFAAIESESALFVAEVLAEESDAVAALVLA